MDERNICCIYVYRGFWQTKRTLLMYVTTTRHRDTHQCAHIKITFSNYMGEVGKSISVHLFIFRYVFTNTKLFTKYMYA